MEIAEFSISNYLDWNAIVSAMISEVEAAREKKTDYTIYNGKRSREFQGMLVYTFQLSSEDKIDPNYITEIRYDSELIRDAQVLGIKGSKIRVSFPPESNLPDQIRMLTLISDPSFIVRQLLDQMNRIRAQDYASVSLLNAVLGSQEGLHTTFDDKERDDLDTVRFNKRQSEAIQKAQCNQVLFIWGPPGTGKTTILGKIISDLVKQDESVLLCSNTNRAVDVSMLKALEVSAYEETPIKERSLRWGNVFLTEEEDLQYVTLPSHHKRLYEQKCEAIKPLYDLLSAYDAFAPALNELTGQLKPHKMKLRKLKELEEAEADGSINETQVERLKALREKLKASSINTDALQKKIERLETERRKVEKQIIGEYKSVQDLRESVNEKTKVTLEEILANIRFHGATFARALIDKDLQLQRFDNVLVDEASMANLPYIIYLLTKAKKRVIFVGDPQQLEPIVLSNTHQAKVWLGTDIFMRVAKTESIDALFNWQQQNSDISVLLQEQYRMPEKVYQIVNELFYRGNLVNRVDSKGIIRVIDTSLLNPPLNFPSKLSHSPVNMVHSELLLSELQDALTKEGDKRELARDIGVMVPFTQQKRFIQYLSKTRYIPDSLEIGVVHTFQGREKPLIYMDLTLSGIDFTYPTFDESKTSALSVSRLLNVGISRCQASPGSTFDGEFVLIANYDYFKRYHRYGIVWSFLEALREAADEIIIPEVEPDPLTAGFVEEPQIDLFSPEEELTEHEVGPVKAADGDNKFAKAIEREAGKIVMAIGQINTWAKSVGLGTVFERSDNIREILGKLPFTICQNATEFIVLVIDLNKLIYESTGGKRAGYPVKQHRAKVGEESYGKIRWILDQLRQFYAHDTTSNDYGSNSRERVKSFVDEFFNSVVDDRDNMEPEDWTRLQLALMSRIVEYLEALHGKLLQRKKAQVG